MKTIQTIITAIAMFTVVMVFIAPIVALVEFELRRKRRKARRLILIPFALLVLTSCSDKDEVNPIQTVTYQVECESCLVYVDDNYRKGDIRQHFVVSGEWEYSFENLKLDTARMEIYVSVFSPPQEIKASIFTNNGKKSSLAENITPGYNGYLNLPLK